MIRWIALLLLFPNLLSAGPNVDDLRGFDKMCNVFLETGELRAAEGFVRLGVDPGPPNSTFGNIEEIYVSPSETFLYLAQGIPGQCMMTSTTAEVAEAVALWNAWTSELAPVFRSEMDPALLEAPEGFVNSRAVAARPEGDGFLFYGMRVLNVPANDVTQITIYAANVADKDPVGCRLWPEECS